MQIPRRVALLLPLMGFPTRAVTPCTAHSPSPSRRLAISAGFIDPSSGTCVAPADRASRILRDHAGGHMAPEPNRTGEEVLRRVQGEFLEMPGLRLTDAQARRLWGLDAASCESLL